MFICIPDILSSEALTRLRGLFDAQDFVDGGATAGWAAAGVKHNRQVSPDSRGYRTMQDLAAAALLQNTVFALAAAPKVMRPLMFSRYLPGMGYGAHVDNALMGQQPQTRVDLAFTLFVSPPEEYEGGELEVDEPAGVRSFKLPAGALVLYPANSIHMVREVTAGRRDVVVGWLQSIVREHERRRVLFELETLRQTLFAQSGKTAAFDTLTRNVSDLWRMWADP